MLTVLPLRSMSCILGNSSSLQAAGDDHSCRYYNPLTAKKDILKNFLCIWWWQMWWWKHVLIKQKITKNSNSIKAMKDSVCLNAKVIRMPNFSESRICPNIYRMFRSVDWTHDMIIVKWHLLIWLKRKLCALINAPPVQSTQRINDYQRYSMLTILPLMSMSSTHGNSSSLWAAGDDHFCRYYNPPSAKKDILKIFLWIWWWQMLWWKHVLTRKL